MNAKTILLVIFVGVICFVIGSLSTVDYIKIFQNNSANVPTTSGLADGSQAQQQPESSFTAPTPTSQSQYTGQMDAALSPIPPSPTHPPIQHTTYSDPDNRFTLKYPKNYILKRTYGSDIEKLTGSSTPHTSAIQIDDNSAIIHANIVVSVEVPTSDNKTAKPSFGSDFPTDPNTTVNGYQAYMHEWQGGGPTRNYAEYYYKTKKYIVFIGTSIPQDKEKNLFDSIIESIKTLE